MDCFPSPLDFMAVVGFALSPVSGSLHSAGLPYSVPMSYITKSPSLKKLNSRIRLSKSMKKLEIRILLSSSPANGEVIRICSMSKFTGSVFLRVWKR